MYGENPFLFFWCKSVLRFIAIPENNAKIQHRSTDFFALFSGIAINYMLNLYRGKNGRKVLDVAKREGLH